MKCEWILCPVCGSKTRNKIRKDTVLENYPLYCPKCRQERLIKVDNLKITVIKEPDKILVSEREKMADGTVKQEIKIYYKFIGFVDELHIIPTKRWAAMPAKNCTVCGVEYVPGSGASRYCPACAKKIRREKSNESKRRSREQKRIACMNCPQKMTD